MNLSNTAKQYAHSGTKLNIIEFAEKSQGLGLKLFPTQKFHLKLFDKVPLDSTTKNIEIRDKFNEKPLYNLTEVEYYKFLWDEGRISMQYDDYWNTDLIQILLAIGRRGTKSTTISIYVAYKLYEILNQYHPQDYFKILPNDPMVVTMAALGEKNANKLFGKFAGIIRPSPFFKPYMLEEPITTELKIWSRYDLDHIDERKGGAHTHSITVTAVPNTPGVRGDNNIFALMDEYAHFNSSGSSTRDKPLDEAIYEALTPSVTGFKHPDGRPFGMTLIFSSPNGKKGNFYKECKMAFEMGSENGVLAIQAPTWETNPSISPKYLKSQYRRNPMSYLQEFGAEFIDGGVNWLTDLGAFYSSFDKKLIPMVKYGRQEKVYFLGVDFALSNDGTAATICHYDPLYEEKREDFLDEAFSYNEKLGELFEKQNFIINGKYVIDNTEVRYAGQPPYEEDTVLPIDSVLNWIRDLYKSFPIQYGIYDQWSGEIIKQLVENKGITRFEMVQHNAMVNDSEAKLFSMLLHGYKLKMPYVITMAKELLNLKGHIRANHLIKVEAPEGSEFHDDTYDSISRALYICHAYNNKDKSILGVSPGLFGNAQLIRRGVIESQSRSSRGRAGSTSMRNPKNLFMNRMTKTPVGRR